MAVVASLDAPEAEPAPVPLRAQRAQIVPMQSIAAGKS
jgi:hypothetical protein